MKGYFFYSSFSKTELVLLCVSAFIQSGLFCSPLLVKYWSQSKTHQAQEDTEQLDHICVCDRVESSNKCVKDRNES